MRKLKARPIPFEYHNSGNLNELIDELYQLLTNVNPAVPEVDIDIDLNGSLTINFFPKDRIEKRPASIDALYRNNYKSF